MLPTLAEYTGSYDTLHMFLGRPALTRLTIKICRAEKLIDELKRVQSHNNVTSLDVTVFDFANDEFIMLLRLFPQLKELRISISLHWHLSVRSTHLGIIRTLDFEHSIGDNNDPNACVQSICGAVDLRAPRALVELHGSLDGRVQPDYP
jgi:hypothetical protein